MKKTKKRHWLSIPLTRAQLEAIQRAAKRRGVNQTNYGREKVLAGTDYDGLSDPEKN